MCRSRATLKHNHERIENVSKHIEMHPLLKPKYLIIELKCLKDIKVEANQVALWHF